jgi:hypothetical protein
MDHPDMSQPPGTPAGKDKGDRGGVFVSPFHGNTLRVKVIFVKDRTKTGKVKKVS